MNAAVDAMVRRALSAMAEFVPLPAVVAKIFDDHADSNLGEFRDIIVSTIETTKFDLKIHETVRDLLRNDAMTRRAEDLVEHEKGKLVETVDGIDLAAPSPAERETLDRLAATPGATLKIARRADGRWGATTDARGDDTLESRRRRRAVGVLSASGAETLSTYGDYFDAFNSDDARVRERAATMQLDCAPRGVQELDVGRAASTRVPGMLEVRAKFVSALPPGEIDGDGARAEDEEPASACAKCDGRHQTVYCPHFPQHREADDDGDPRPSPGSSNNAP